MTDFKPTTEEETFVKSLRDLHEYVDKTMFDRPVWESSAMFSVCLYAMRISALLVLGRVEVSLGMLFRGARMDQRTKRISVKLAPSRVFRVLKSLILQRLLPFLDKGIRQKRSTGHRVAVLQ